MQDVNSLSTLKEMYSFVASTTTTTAAWPGVTSGWQHVYMGIPATVDKEGVHLDSLTLNSYIAKAWTAAMPVTGLFLVHSAYSGISVKFITDVPEMLHVPNGHEQPYGAATALTHYWFTVYDPLPVKFIVSHGRVLALVTRRVVDVPSGQSMHAANAVSWSFYDGYGWTTWMLEAAIAANNLPVLGGQKQCYAWLSAEDMLYLYGKHWLHVQVAWPTLMKLWIQWHIEAATKPQAQGVTDGEQQ